MCFKNKIFHAFRPVASELLQSNSRPHRVLRFPHFTGSGFSNIASAHYRRLHTSLLRNAWVKNKQPPRPEISEEERKRKEQKAREIGLKDEFIPYQKVQVNYPEGLSDFRSLKDVIAEIEGQNAREERGKRYHAVLVANDPDPIVKIVDYRAEYRKKKEAQEKAKASAAQKIRKEVQLSWASSEADVETKLEKVKGDLEKGFKVDIVIGAGKGTMRWPNQDEQNKRVEEIVKRFQGIAKEWKEASFAGPTVVIYLQGIVQISMAEQADRKAQKAVLRQQRREAQEERIRKRRELETSSDA